MAWAGVALASEASDQREREKARRVSEAFGTCVVKHAGSEARAFVRTVVYSDEGATRRQKNKLFDGDCLIEAARASGGVQMTFPATTFHNALAVALVQADYPSYRELDFSAAPKLLNAEILPADSFVTKHRGRRAERDREQFDTQRMDAIMAWVGECTVRAAPKESHALIVTPVLTPDENSALLALRNGLSGCVPQGATVSLDTGYIRGVLARSYWRLADHVAHVDHESLN